MIMDSRTKALTWTLIGAAVKQVFGLVTSIMLARLLGPSDFGIIAVAMVFVSLTNVFIDSGLSEGVIQIKEATNRHFDTIFFFNLGVSLLFSLLIFSLANPIGNFYEEADLGLVLQYLSVIPLIAGLGIVHKAILVRSLNFKSLALRDTAALFFGGSAGIIAAYQGFGIYSLVWKELISVSIGVLALWSGSKWKPSFVFSKKSLNELMNFSLFIFFDNILRQFFNRINTLFLGKIFSPTVLGFYARAESLNLMVSDYTSNSIRKVIFPVLSSLQDNEKEFQMVLIKSLNLALALTFLLAGFLYFIGDPLIIFLLTEKWAPTVPLFRTLVFTSVASTAIAIYARAILSKGLAKVKFRMGLFQRFFALLPLPIGFIYGVQEFAIAFLVSKFLIVFVYTFFAKKYLTLDFIVSVKAFMLPIVPLLLFMAVFDWFRILNWPELLVGAAYGLSFFLYLRMVNHPLFNFGKGQILKLLQKVRV